MIESFLMKYSPQIYARALSEIVTEPSADKRTADLIKNFLALVIKNNDQHQLKKIYARAEKMVREKTGKRKVAVETARQIKNLKSALKEIIKKGDIIGEKINPDLIAGMKIIINDEMQFDGSMANKIKRLFSD
jgi:F0F1-type ATP synthase delta subunit